MSEMYTAGDIVNERTMIQPAHFNHTNDPSELITRVGTPEFMVRAHSVDPNVIMAARPPQESITASSIPIDFEALIADARGRAGDKFKFIIRGANIFDVYRSSKTAEQHEADAVNLLGPDMSLYLHGAHQARRMERLMDMQQVAHRYVFNALHTKWGNTAATVASYNSFRYLVPNFNMRDVKYGMLCAILHDYGEAELGLEVSLVQKKDPAYAIIERAMAVKLAQELHTPTGTSPKNWSTLRERYLAGENSGVSMPGKADLAEVASYLYTEEVSEALEGTEAQRYEERGQAFSAVERLEYVLTALRVLEAVEHNRQGVRSDEYLTRQILWLGVDSIINSLEKTTSYAEKYVAIYDFLAFNSNDIDHYLQKLTKDIELRAHGEASKANEVFAMDPFSSYQNEDSRFSSISPEEAQMRLLSIKEHWDQWKYKEHLVRDVWEAFIGTDHSMGARQEDLSFSHYTLRQRRRFLAQAGKIALALPVADQFGVGLDPEVRLQHEQHLYN